MIWVLGSALGHPLGHHERHVGARLAERFEHQPVGLLQHHLDRLGVRRRRARPTYGHAASGPSNRGAPALERGDAVGGRHRLAVVPFQAVAQGEGPGELVGADRPAVDHLRLDLQLVVEREQRVVDHVAVVSGDQRRGPDRVEDLEDPNGCRQALSVVSALAGAASGEQRLTADARRRMAKRSSGELGDEEDLASCVAKRRTCIISLLPPSDAGLSATRCGGVHDPT